MARRASDLQSPQLTLPFFTSEPPARRGGRKLPERASAEPLAPATTAAPVPAPPSGPPIFRHPRANREVLLGEHLIGYELKRAKRRSIGFVVSTEGLSVSAPRWVAGSEIESALHDKGSWILRKLAEQADRNKRLQQSRVEWCDGTSLPFLGETVIVVLDPRATGAVLNSDADALPGVPRLALHVGLPQHASPEQIRDAVQSWLQRQARRVFEERCAHFAERLGVRYQRLSLSSAQTRWGSASVDGSIRLNWRLIHFALPTIDYVVAHELAHLREMNHSPRFWDVVRSVMPDYEQVRGTLKETVLPVLD
ncbi:M48 family metallopeptidase [Caldimonas brevitalea]|uniref:Metal-dependent hydrolase n=1 Tax=Caldimonas brevitalea TaxID=413882 RepID=A0A0G3BPP1_9BURK|nr:SprT family zinc-dependent metalloprotease [Caldimonas brevitalea]AKJ31399.1 metal-dependent hydrolase [Caldimonas brevitalea]